MGSASGQDCERPVHRVWVDAFQLAATQVTNAEYAHFLRSTGSQPPPFWTDKNFSDPQQPVTGVSWFDARSITVSGCPRKPASRTVFPAKRNGSAPLAAISNNKIFPWGNDPPQSLPDYATRWQTGPEPVARYAPNTFGLYNICDNVHEWCSDWYDPNYYAISPDHNPRGPKPRARPAQSLSRWIMAPSRENRTLLRPLQHPSRVSVC